MKLKLFVFLLCLAALSFACGDSDKTANGKKPVIVPKADADVAVIEMENAAAFGTITIELYSNIAPKMVARFKELAKEGVYNGTTFHRINDTVIQGGDPFSKDSDPANDGQGRSDKPNLPAEFLNIPFDTGIVGAARSQDINSANSQFFIMLKREPGFDGKYTVFGKVIDGMNNAVTISGVQPKEGERPIEPVRIKSITIKPRT